MAKIVGYRQFGAVPIDLVTRAHHARLLGYDIGSEASFEDMHGYASLGADAPRSPYDLNQPGAIRELKAALKKLNEYQQTHGLFGKSQDAYGQALSDDDVWTDDSIIEFLAAVSRYSHDFSPLGMPPGPYVQFTPFGPQPTVMGLELIDGALNDRRASWSPLTSPRSGEPFMAIFEKWRGGSCLPGTTVIGGSCGYGLSSAPPAKTPVIPTTNVNLSSVHPPPSLVKPGCPPELPTNYIDANSGEYRCMDENGNSAPFLWQNAQYDKYAAAVSQVQVLDAALGLTYEQTIAADSEAKRQVKLDQLKQTMTARAQAVNDANALAPSYAVTAAAKTDVTKAVADCRAAGGTFDPITLKCVMPGAPPPQPGPPAPTKKPDEAGMSNETIALLLLGGAGLFYLWNERKKKGRGHAPNRRRRR
jgi:hypothetical protein